VKPAPETRLDTPQNPVIPTPLPGRESAAAGGQWPSAQSERHEPVSVWSAARAVDTALENGDLDLAWKTVSDTVAHARQSIVESGRTPAHVRDLSVSLNKLGDVAQALGRLDEARSAYAEGETLARELIGDFGRTPERLRDLSVSLNKLGDVAQALGRLDEAGARLRRRRKHWPAS
jgi:tetratricopeptide (TPR) repeat protein